MCSNSLWITTWHIQVFYYWMILFWNIKSLTFFSVCFFLLHFKNPLLSLLCSVLYSDFHFKYMIFCTHHHSGSFPSWLPHFHGWNIITFVLPIESNDVSKQPTLQPQKKLFHLWKKALFLICYKCCLYCKNIDQSKTMIWVIIFQFRIWWLKRADK